MTVAKHGVSIDTPDRILIDAGVVYPNWTSVDTPGDPLGATKGGSVFEINRTIKRIDPDGAKGPVKGFRRVEEVVATLTVNLIEITKENLLIALAGSAANGGQVITGGEIGHSGADDDYIDKVALVGTITGFDGTEEPIILVLENCLVDGPFSLGLNPKDEAVLTMVFTAHFDPDTLDVEPWSITYPSA